MQTGLIDIHNYACLKFRAKQWYCAHAPAREHVQKAGHKELAAW